MLKNGTCLAAALAVTAPAMADSIDMTWRGQGTGETVLVTHNERSMRAFAGDLRYQFARGEGAASRFEGERTVLRQSLTDGSARSLLARRPGPSRVDMGYESAALTEDQRSAIGAAMAMVAAGGASPAAAQLAVWEITHDFGDLDLRGGSFSADVDDAMLAEVDAMLEARNGDSAAPYARFGADQGLAVLTTDEGPAAVMSDAAMAPLPAPLLLGGAGLAMAVVASRRRTRS